MTVSEDFNIIGLGSKRPCSLFKRWQQRKQAQVVLQEIHIRVINSGWDAAVRLNVHEWLGEGATSAVSSSAAAAAAAATTASLHKQEGN